MYFPSCRECDGLLNITINPSNFSINYKCEYNDCHKIMIFFLRLLKEFISKKKKYINA